MVSKFGTSNQNMAGSQMQDPYNFLGSLAYDSPFSSYHKSTYFDPYTTDLRGVSKPLQQRQGGDLLAYHEGNNPYGLSVATSSYLNDGYWGSYGNLRKGDMDAIGQTYNNYGAIDGSAEALSRMGVKYNPASIDLARNFSRYATTLGGKDDYGKVVAGGRMMLDSAKAMGYQIPQGMDSSLSLAQLGGSSFGLLNNWNDMNSEERFFATLGLHSGLGKMNAGAFDGIYNSLPDVGQDAINFMGAPFKTADRFLSKAGDEIYQLAEPVVPNSLKTSNPTMFGKTGAGIATGAAAAFTGYQTAKNWGELNNYEKISGVTSTAAQGAASAASFGSKGAASVSPYLGYAGAALAAYSMVDNFGKGGNAKTRLAGAANGAAIGTAILPGVGTAIGAVLGTAIGSIKAGISNPGQIKRSAYRNGLAEGGILVKGGDAVKGKMVKGEDDTETANPFNLSGGGELRKDHQYLELADGTLYDTSREGDKSEYYKEVKDPSRISDDLKKKMQQKDGKYYIRSYNTDMTSDLDLMTNLIAKPLNMATMGGSIEHKTESEKGQLEGVYTNGWLSNTKDREFAQENFDTAMSNAKVTYNKLGVKSSEDMKALADKLKTEGKITNDEYNNFLIAGDFIFAEDRAGAFSRAQSLYQLLGSGKGLDKLTSSQMKSYEDEKSDILDRMKNGKITQEEGSRLVEEVDKKYQDLNAGVSGEDAMTSSPTTGSDPAATATARDKTFEMIGQQKTAEEISKTVSSDKKKQDAIRKRIDELVEQKASPQDIAQEVQDMA